MENAHIDHGMCAMGSVVYVFFGMKNKAIEFFDLDNSAMNSWS